MIPTPPTAGLAGPKAFAKTPENQPMAYRQPAESGSVPFPQLKDDTTGTVIPILFIT
jgi:hypothetical protein